VVRYLLLRLNLDASRADVAVRRVREVARDFWNPAEDVGGAKSQFRVRLAGSLQTPWARTDTGELINSPSAARKTMVFVHNELDTCCTGREACIGLPPRFDAKHISRKGLLLISIGIGAARASCGIRVFDHRI
jgi:hypothetical protein